MSEGQGPGAITDLIRSCRPWQWVKNGVVLLPLVFGSHRDEPAAIGATLLTAAAFCLLASAVYLVNDAIDREDDARHPTRRRRPIAAGRITATTACIIAAILLTTGSAVLRMVDLTGGKRTLVFGALYLALQALYVSLLKPWPRWGALAIASGFVLRAEAGGAASAVEVSYWLVICTFLGALGVSLGKRATDARLLGGGAGEIRSLERTTGLALLAFVIAFSLYTVSPRTVREFGTHGFALAIPWVAYGAFRFGDVVRSTEQALDPARAFLSDRRLLLAVTGFVLTVAGVLLARSHGLP